MSRGAGWTILGVVGLVWIVLGRWMSTDYCDVACLFLGRRTLGLFFWVVSLAAVPMAAWLLVGGYAPNGEARTRSVPAALITRVLYLFSAAMVWIAVYAAVHIVAEIGSLTFDDDAYGDLFRAGPREDALTTAGFIFVWCALIGFVTLVATCKLDASLEPAPSPPLLWLGAGLVALVAFVGAVASLAEIDRGPESIYERFEPYRPEYEAEGAPTPHSDEATATVPPSPSPPPSRVLGYLPVTVRHGRSGYKIFDPRVQIRANPSGTVYRVTFAGVWTADGKPGHQRCDYSFLDRNNTPVLIRDVGFEFGQHAHAFDLHAISFFASDMDHKPARAKIHCYDSRL